MDDDFRKQLIDYYKWVVSIAVFVLTTSIALTSFIGPPVHHLWLLAIGWTLLAVAVGMDWLLVKSLVSYGAVMATPVEKWTAKHRLFIEGWDRRARVFGFVQQWALMLGAGFVALVFVLRLFGN